MGAKWVKRTVEIPKNLNPQQRDLVAEELLRFLRKRTAKGQGKGGKSFPGYSKEYKESLDFKIAGKSPTKTNLKLSGDMIAAMDTLSHKKGEIRYGFENGTDENARAEGNILGSYGGEPDAKKARNFIDLTQDEMDKVLKIAADKDSAIGKIIKVIE